MKSYCKFFSLIVLLFVANTVCGQNDKFTLQGIVIDENSEAVIAATVFVQGTDIGVSTDQFGKFSIQYTAGPAVLGVKYIGYKDFATQVVFKAKSQELHVKLQLDQATLGDIIINTKSKVSKIKEQAFTVNSLDMKSLANSTMDLNDILNKSTGIKVRQQGGVGSDYNFSVNGMSGKSVKFFVDGVPLDMLGKGVDMNSLPVNMAERVEIYKGVVPVFLSTDAMGGAVNIISNTASKDYLDASYTGGSFNTHKVNLNGQIKDDKTGLIMRLNTFYTQSDNDYKMRGMKIYNEETKQYDTKDVKRFNDAYQAMFVMTEFGVTNKKWADAFFIGTSYSQFDKQIQTGSNQDVVYGKVKQKGDANNYFLKYKLNDLLDHRMDINFYAGYSKSLDKGTDTLMRKYSWNGSYLPSASSEIGNKSLNRIYRDRLYTQLNLVYRLSDFHQLNFNYTVDYIKNKTFNALDEIKEEVPPAIMTKQILALSYQQDWFDKRWSTIVFGKYYVVDLQKTIWDGWAKANSIEKSNSADFGYGLATTFKITNDIGVKASYEHSYRLLEPQEIFGDGITITSNMDLKPESSNNFNLGAYYSQRFDTHFLHVEAGGYVRDTKDFIYTVPNLFNSTFKYENLTNIFTKGLEGEVNYQYKKLLNVMMNISYNYAYDNTKYVNNSQDVVSATYKKEVPNQPWLFGNIDVSIGQDNVFASNSRLELHYGVQMTEWYYKNWQAYGNIKNIPTIPRQILHNIGVSYSLANGKYNFALDCTNLGDALAFDNFKLQKQGRAFYFKFRYALK